MERNNSSVVLLPCSNYEDGVYEKIKCGIDLLGGIERFADKNERVLIKPNVIAGLPAEQAATTHPAVFGAVIKCFIDAGYSKVFYGDSPGTPRGEAGKALKAAGFTDEAAKYDVPMADFDHSVTVKYPEGKSCREFILCKAAVETDAIINVCKMKTHALENITGAVKNQYGFVAGLNKGLGHAIFPDSQSFANMIADLNGYLKPRLHVLDGVIAMEGNGPVSGNPTPMKVILMSEDPVALDTTFARLVYLDPDMVPTCIAGAKAGIGTMDESRIRVVTPDGEMNIKEAAEKFGNPKFDVRREKPKFWRLRMLFPFMRPKKDRPVVDPDKCIACGICQDACPVDGKAVTSGNGQKAKYDYTKCIRCYCCQEMCPAKAITKEVNGR